ncbi:MAG: alpha/beta hydrolase [Actinobacteria bacterium]|nr:alpha/beta hydrolase [Actinomycetota bacterium]
MASWQAEVVKRSFVAGLKAQRFLVGDIDPEAPEEDMEAFALKLREQMELATAYVPRGRDITVREVDEPTPAEWVRSERAQEDRVILHLHGGAYLMGSPRTHRGMASALSRVARARVVVPDYRLAPEHRFPAALEDSMAWYRHLLDQGVDPSRFAVSGDSAGGGLAVAVMLEAKREGLPLPACYVGMSPWTDLAGTGRSMTERASRDPWLRSDLVPTAARGYAGDHPLDDPRISPLYGDLAGLPPMLVHAGTEEILWDDGRRLVERAREAGVDASFGSFEGMWHVFQAFPGLPETRSALREIGAFVRRHTTEHADAGARARTSAA